MPWAVRYAKIRLPVHPRALACLLAIVPFAAAAEVDPAERNETFAPEPTAQPRIEIQRAESAATRPAADERVQFVTVPADAAQVRPPAIRPTETAPVDLTPRAFPTRQPERAPITTARPAPAKFERKLPAPTVVRIQDGLTAAGAVKTGKVKVRSKASALERINRFVFRRNTAETEPAVTPAGGANDPAGSESPAPGSAGS